MSTSGRQYGDTKTNAYTEYYGLTPTFARSYYGQ